MNTPTTQENGAQKPVLRPHYITGGKNMEEKKITLYDENIMLHKLATRFEIARDYVINAIEHENYPTIGRELCVLMDIDYDEIKKGV